MKSPAPLFSDSGVVDRELVLPIGSYPTITAQPVAHN